MLMAFAEDSPRVKKRALKRRLWAGEVMVLDSGATAHLFRYRGALANVDRCHKPVTFTGLTHTLEVELEGDHPHLGPVYHHPDAIANIVSLSALARAKGVRVTYDSYHPKLRYSVHVNKQLVYQITRRLCTWAN